MKPAVLPTLAAESTKDIVETLKRILARAEKGEFLDLALFAREAGGEITVERVASEPMMLLACLERAKWELVRDLQGEEAG